MQHRSFIYRVYDLYRDGFRHMRLGKTLWLIIGIKLFIFFVLVKLFVIFVVLKLFFFPHFIGQHAKEGEEDAFVATQLLERE